MLTKPKVKVTFEPMADGFVVELLANGKWVLIGFSQISENAAIEAAKKYLAEVLEVIDAP